MPIAQSLQNPFIIYNNRLKQTFSPIQATSCTGKLQEIAKRVGLVAIVIFAEFFLGMAWSIGKLLDYFNNPSKEVLDQSSQRQMQKPLDQNVPAKKVEVIIKADQEELSGRKNVDLVQKNTNSIFDTLKATSKRAREVGNNSANLYPMNGRPDVGVSSIQRMSHEMIEQISEIPFNGQKTNGDQRLQYLMQKALDRKAPVKEVEAIIKAAREEISRGKNVDLVIKNTIKILGDLIATSKRAQKVGNKAANLYRLQGILNGMPDVRVPSFQGISHTVIEQVIKKEFPAFNLLWKNFIDAMQRQDQQSAEGVLAKIRTGIEASFKNNFGFLDAELGKFLMGVSPKDTLMVRSTGREDEMVLSNPGGNESIPNVRPQSQSIAEAIGKVIASYFSRKSLDQRMASGNDITTAPFMPVLVQVMVGEKSENNIPVSGVMFTAEGSMNTKGVVQISAAPGHAEGVVTGTQSVDVFYVTDGFVHSIIQKKDQRKVPSEEGTLTTAQNPPSIARVACLSSIQLHRLAKIGQEIEKRYGYAMDIEWSFDPKDNIFFIFQARPISPNKIEKQPSYVIPQRIKELEFVEQVNVIHPGGGSVCQINTDNTIIASSAPIALKQYLESGPKKKEYKTVIIASPTAPNSHEASFFRERGIAVIYLQGDQYRRAANILKENTQTLLIDVQEGFSGIVPKHTESSGFLAQGLRRHLAPKMESIDNQQLVFESVPFLKKILFLSKGFNKKNLKLAFGWNMIDSILNTFERAETSQERAYLLTSLVRILDRRLLLKIPEYERIGLRNKILYNMHHAWTVFEDAEMDPLHRKYAMNWLRSSLLKRPVSGIIASESLYSALDAVKERNILSRTSTLSTQSTNDRVKPYLDIFERSRKFILLPANKQNWKTFISKLNFLQAQTLAGLFAKLGPKTVELWMNVAFPRMWESSSKSVDPVSQCLSNIQNALKKDDSREALDIASATDSAVRRFDAIGEVIGDPAKFAMVLKLIDQELVPLTSRCLSAMKSSTNFTSALLAFSYQRLIDAFDNCIKGHTSSPQYDDNQTLKAERFAMLLERYLTLTQEAMDEEFFKDNLSLARQAKGLRAFLPKIFVNLKEKILKDPKKLLLPSTYFSVAMAALGSCQLDPYRALPYSLEDFFTQLHQSQMTVAHVVGTRGGLQVQDLPTELRLATQSLCSQLDRRLEKPGEHPFVQSIQYDYPTIRVTLNCPLNHHSAQFILEGMLSPSGKPISLTLESQFFSPINGIGLSGRDYHITLMALDANYPKDSRVPMKFAKDFVMKPPLRGTTQFKWDMSFNEVNGSKKQWPTGIANLQKMIDFLQNPFEEAKKFNPFNETALQHYPWMLDLLAHSLEYSANADTKNKTITTFLKAILDDFSIENVDIFLESNHLVFKNIQMTNLESRRLIYEVTNRLANTPSLWKDHKRFVHLAGYFLVIHPSSDTWYSKDVRSMNLTAEPGLSKLLAAYATHIPLSTDLEKIDLRSWQIDYPIKFKKIFEK